jgi:uncharacterized protein (DUF924 family)
MQELQMGGISDVVTFWRAAGDEQWYKRDDAFDASIRERFLALWHKAVAGELSSWEATDDGALALVILLDQFPRNMFRDDPKAYSSDALARDVVHRALARGADRRIEAPLLQFLYLPFMHSEDLADQLRCVDLFRATDDTENLRYAEETCRHYPPVRALSAPKPRSWSRHGA